MDDNQSLTPKASLLIVDDIHKNLQVLGKMLRKEEAYEIAFSDNGAQALKIAAKLHPDLILLDVMMPEMDGFEVCRQLKADPETREISIMFLTARAEVDSVVKGFDVGAVDYITKPFNKRELIARVNNHLERIRSKRDLQLRNEELSKAMEEIKTLRGILPICAECKKVRDDKGYWEKIEKYIASHSEVSFTHGICPGCARKLYGGEDWFDEHCADVFAER